MFFGLLSFSESLARMINASSPTSCISLNNHPCTARPTLIDLIRNEYNQGLRYYPFMVNLNRCNGSCNNITVND